MANNTKRRPMNQRPSTYKSLPFTIHGGKRTKKVARAAGKGIDGVDRRKIDALDGERRAAESLLEVWDE